MTTKPSIITTVERISYDLSKSFYLIDVDEITKAVDNAIAKGFATFVNHIGGKAQLFYDGEIFKASDSSLGIIRYFHLPLEYAKLTRYPTLKGYLEIDPNAYSVYNKTVPKHRSITPSNIYDLLSDIDIYFEIDKNVSYGKLKELLVNNTSIIKKETAHHGLLKTNDLVTFQVDNLTYPAITVTKTGIRPRRKFTRYVIDKTLIKSLLEN